jgi:hypothetical protein
MRAGELRLHLAPVGPLRRRPELLHDLVETAAEHMSTTITVAR